MENIDYYLQSKHKYKRAIPLIVKLLHNKIGRARAIKQPDLLALVRQRVPSFNARSLRWAIHDIRLQHLLPGLVGSNYGFYIEPDPEKFKDHALRLAGYIKSMTEVHDALIQDYWTLKTPKTE